MNMSFPIVESFLNQMAQSLPKVGLAIVVFILGWIVIKIVTRVVTRILVTLKIDNLGEKLNEIDLIQKSKFKVKPSAIIGKLLYYFLLLIVLIIATEIIDIPTVSGLVEQLLALVPKILIALIILFLGILFSEAIRKMVLTLCQSFGLPSAKFIASAVFYFLLINVFITALAQIGISTAFLEGNFMILIGGGVLAFAIGYGLASKDLVKNFLSSFYVKDKISIGDIIKIDGVTGEIVDIEKSSIILRAEDRIIVIPMNKIVQDKLEIIDKSTE